MSEMMICSSTDRTPEDERITVRDTAMAAETQTKEGDTYYLITQRWWQHWLEYVNQDHVNITNDEPSSLEAYDSIGSSNSKRPSGIDNSGLIYDAASEDTSVGIELHDTLVEGRDYVLLPREVWNIFYLWYGGGPTVARKVINSGISQMELSVEVYPLRLQLVFLPKGDRKTIRISKKETVGELYRRACDAFDLSLEQVCIWDYYGQQKHALMKDMDKTLDGSNIQMDQDILVEFVNNGNGTAFDDSISSIQENGYADTEATSVLVEPSKSSLSIAGGLAASKNVSRSCSSDLLQSQNLISPNRGSDNSYGVSASGVTTRGVSGGLTGLLNLGNTCFMNSAIQCLVHTPEFARYFQEDFYQEINWQNPLGMVGELAIAFGELLRKLWAPGRTPVAPRSFKAKLARFAPQFSGYNQHDSQELLAFLLDGLHEDLNRVKNKPYIKSRDDDDRLDEEVADEYWENHIARNDSIIVDVCQGQYKSTLVCPVCNKVSVTFDPFMYLSLPLQSSTTRAMTVTVFTCDGSTLPSAYTVAVPKHGSCRDLLQALKNACSMTHSERLLLAEIQSHLISHFLEDPLTLLSTINDDDHLAAYRIPKLTNNIVFLQLIHRCGEQDGGIISGKIECKPYGTPLLSPISRDNVVTRGDVQSMVLKMLSPMLRPEFVGHADISGVSQDADSGEADTKMSILPIQLVDENDTCIDLMVDEEKAISLPSSSKSVLLFINWSQKLLTKYDTHYLETMPEVAKYGPVTKKARTEPLSMYTCLEAFLREEPLVPEDMWFCPQCKERRQASKKLDLWRLPEVLVIHLKRFSYSRSMKHKLETFVNFPIHGFDLTNYVAHNSNYGRQIYELYALTNHYGGMGSGHYTAHIKLLDENRWYNFDDSHITFINEDDVKSGAAYVLFYRRVETDDASVSNGLQYFAPHDNISLEK